MATESYKCPKCGDDCWRDDVRRRGWRHLWAMGLPWLRLVGRSDVRRERGVKGDGTRREGGSVGRGDPEGWLRLMSEKRSAPNPWLEALQRSEAEVRHLRRVVDRQHERIASLARAPNPPKLRPRTHGLDPKPIAP